MVPTGSGVVPTMVLLNWIVKTFVVIQLNHTVSNFLLQGSGTAQQGSKDSPVEMDIHAEMIHSFVTTGIVKQEPGA